MNERAPTAAADQLRALWRSLQPMTPELAALVAKLLSAALHLVAADPRAAADGGFPGRRACSSHPTGGCEACSEAWQAEANRMSALLAALAGDAAAAQNGTPPTLLRASELRRSPDADVDGAPSVALARPELRGPTGGGPGGRSPTTRGPAPPPAQRGSAAAGRAEAAVWAAEVARRRASADAKVEAVGRAVAGVAAAEAGWAALCRQVTVGCCGGGIVFVTPEMGRWGSVGGLGGMVANLSRALAARGLDVTVIAPAYRSLASEWADASELASCRKVTVALGRERCAVEVLTDRHDKVRLLLLRSEHFAAPYKGRGGGDAWHALVPAVLLARGALELMRELRMTPAAVITNDWVAALTAPYARARGGEAVGGGAEYWERTAFVHLFHNLEPGYDGTIALPAQKGEKYDPSPAEPLAALHQLPSALLHDEGQAGRALSLSRAALLASNAWATVSPGYRSQLLASSAAFAPLLRTFRAPFACAGGLPPSPSCARRSSRTAVTRWRSASCSAAASARRACSTSPSSASSAASATRRASTSSSTASPPCSSTRAAASSSSSAARPTAATRTASAAPRRCARSATPTRATSGRRRGATSPTARSRAPAPTTG